MLHESPAELQMEPIPAVLNRTVDEGEDDARFFPVIVCTDKQHSSQTRIQMHLFCHLLYTRVGMSMKSVSAPAFS